MDLFCTWRHTKQKLRINANKKANAKIFKYFPHLFDQDLLFTNVFPKL